MARVRSFGPSNQSLRVHPTEVDCEFGVVDDGSVKLLHLSTFGSDDRAGDRKSSQSLQLDVEQAQRLVEIIDATFPQIRTS